MQIDQLFPVCLVPTCSRQGMRHALQWQRDLFTYPERYIYCQGGVGSAKTIAFAARFTLDMLLVPHNRGIIFRKDFNLNYKTSWMRFRDCIEGLVHQGLIPPPQWSVKKFGEYTKCTLANGSVVEAGQSKNWSEYLGPEYGSVWVDDAMESSAEMWTGKGTIGGLESRIRLGQAAYATLNGQPYNALRGYLSTNPPPGVSDWWALFGQQPGVRTFAHSTVAYRHLQVSSRDNDHLPPDYLATIEAHHSADDVARIVRGESVVYYGGKGVYKGSFHPRRHVSQFACEPTLPLLVSVDFGYQHPAITYSQIRQCPFDGEHHITLSEVTDQYDVSTWDLWDAHRAHREALYPHQDDMVFYACDIAGFKSSDASKDKRGPASVWVEEFNIHFLRRKMAVEPSLDTLRSLWKSQCRCGLSRLLVDRQCRMLIEALEGGYRYPQKKDGTFGDQPTGDHRYEDVGDAHRYSVENFLKWGVPWRTRVLVEQRQAGVQSPWAWMEPLGAPAAGRVEVY